MSVERETSSSGYVIAGNVARGTRAVRVRIAAALAVATGAALATYAVGVGLDAPAGRSKEASEASAIDGVGDAVAAATRVDAALGPGKSSHRGGADAEAVVESGARHAVEGDAGEPSAKAAPSNAHPEAGADAAAGAAPEGGIEGLPPLPGAPADAGPDVGDDTGAFPVSLTAG
jgi:hypothetical protein